MRHQALEVVVVAGERAQIVGEADFIRKTGEVAGQAYVQRLAFERDDPRVRKQGGNEAKMQEVERQLVGYPGSADINVAQPLQVSVCQRTELPVVEIQHTGWIGIRRTLRLGGHVRNRGQL